MTVVTEYDELLCSLVVKCSIISRESLLPTVGIDHVSQMSYRYAIRPRLLLIGVYDTSSSPGRFPSHISP